MSRLDRSPLPDPLETSSHLIPFLRMTTPILIV
jgi:hypothetical protein